MKQIRKYPVQPFSSATVPQGHVLGFSEQGQQLYVWIEVELEGENGSRLVTVYPTGAEVPARAQHRGSTVTATGLVWHLYERA